MSDAIIDCTQGFTNFRGSFKLKGLLDIGTHCSLVERPSGTFIMLDSMELSGEQRDTFDSLTDGGAKLEAVLNLHPFHTIHVEWAHKEFPQAKHYGTARHLAKFPALSWQSEKCEDEAFGALFADTLEFTEPDGVILIPDDETVHFSSIMAFHRKSGTIHVDDTLSYFELPFPLSLMPMSGRLDFHPALGKALEPHAGAADTFRSWAIDTGIAWHDAARVATAHNGLFDIGEDSFPDLIGAALGRVKPVLDQHRQNYG